MTVYVLRPHRAECQGCMGENRFSARHHVRKDVIILAPLRPGEYYQPNENDIFDLPDYDPLAMG